MFVVTACGFSINLNVLCLINSVLTVCATVFVMKMSPDAISIHLTRPCQMVA